MMSLFELAERCEQATGPDRELDTIIEAFLEGYTDITERNGWISAWNGDRSRTLGLIDPSSTTGNRNFTPQSHMTPAYTASLDAAMTLIAPGVFFHVSRFSPESDGRGQAHVYPNRGLGDDYEAEAATPALALCAAALRARAAVALEAATAGETTEIGSTEGESPTAESGDAQPSPANPYDR